MSFLRYLLNLHITTIHSSDSRLAPNVAKTWKCWNVRVIKTSCRRCSTFFLSNGPFNSCTLLVSYYSIGIRFSHIFSLEMSRFIKIVKSRTICSYHPMKLVSLIESARISISIFNLQNICIYIATLLSSPSMFIVAENSSNRSERRSLPWVTIFPLSPKSRARNGGSIYQGQLLTDEHEICAYYSRITGTFWSWIQFELIPS